MRRRYDMPAVVCNANRLPTAFAAFVLCSWPLPSYANFGVPLFSTYVFYSWLLLIPIVGVEAYVLLKRLPVSVARASSVAALANIASTVLGSVALVAISLSLGVGLGMMELPGAIGDIMVLIALVPCFFLSVWLEVLVGALLLKQTPRDTLRAAFYVANQFSYAMLAIVPVARIAKNLIVQGRVNW